MRFALKSICGHLTDKESAFHCTTSGTVTENPLIQLVQHVVPGPKLAQNVWVVRGWWLPAPLKLRIAGCS